MFSVCSALFYLLRRSSPRCQLSSHSVSSTGRGRKKTQVAVEHGGQTDRQAAWTAAQVCPFCTEELLCRLACTQQVVCRVDRYPFRFPPVASGREGEGEGTNPPRIQGEEIRSPTDSSLTRSRAATDLSREANDEAGSQRASEQASEAWHLRAGARVSVCVRVCRRGRGPEPDRRRWLWPAQPTTL